MVATTVSQSDTAKQDTASQLKACVLILETVWQAGEPASLGLSGARGLLSFGSAPVGAGTAGVGL